MGGPELRILFFSGGTALAPVAAELSRHTASAIHVITTFDSGGSSAVLRRAFDMPAVGDIRARIMALADRSLAGNPETVALLGYRLSTKEGRAELRRELETMAAGTHPLVAAIPEPMHEIAAQHLAAFLAQMPEDMELAGASIGNLILTSGYLSLDRQLEPVVRAFSGMVQARGVVLPVADRCAHLCVELADGEVIVGQHRFTGKTAASIAAPIRDMWLSASLENAEPISVPMQPRLGSVIRGADLICYPIGSFFSSVMANLLPEGVGCAIREAACPKVFIPNLGTDPELFGLSVQDQVEWLLRFGSGEGCPAGQVLNWLLVDGDESRYPGGIPHAWLAGKGIRVRRARLVAEPPYLDAGLLCRELLGEWK